MRELMALPINEIRFEDVQAFCAHETPENIRLDYKERFSDKDAAKQIAKLVAAFANTQGGTILFGVAESGSRKPDKNPPGTNLGSDPKATIQSASFHTVFPPIVPEISDFIANPTDKNLGFVVVRVGASEEIHTMDRGTGIYVRVNDQSEPQPADIERIEWMLQRRNRAQSILADRRAKLLKILRRSLGYPSSRGLVYVTVGPKVMIEPFLDYGDLVPLAREISIPVHWMDGKSPIDDSWLVRSIESGIYSCDPRMDGFRDHAGAIDAFGNIALAAQLLQPRKVAGIVPNDFEKLRIDGVDPEGIEVGYAIERLLCAIKVASSFYNKFAFVGICEIVFQAPQASEYFLARTGNTSSRVLGVCAPESEVEIRETVTTTDLGEKVSTTLANLVGKLLWAWGCMDSTIIPATIDEAEQCHYGNAICECKRWHRPRNHSKCLRCRSEK